MCSDGGDKMLVQHTFLSTSDVSALSDVAHYTIISSR